MLFKNLDHSRTGTERKKEHILLEGRSLCYISQIFDRQKANPLFSAYQCMFPTERFICAFVPKNQESIEEHLMMKNKFDNGFVNWPCRMKRFVFVAQCHAYKNKRVGNLRS